MFFKFIWKLQFKYVEILSDEEQNQLQFDVKNSPEFSHKVKSRTIKLPPLYLSLMLFFWEAFNTDNVVAPKITI